MGGGAGDAIMICTIGGNAGANRCSGASLCISEMIIIPGASDNTAGSSPPVGETYDRSRSFLRKIFYFLIYRFCGSTLNSLGFPANNQPIISCDCPFELSHITGITALTATNSLSPTGIGFQLSYRQIPGNC